MFYGCTNYKLIYFIRVKIYTYIYYSLVVFIMQIIFGELEPIFERNVSVPQIVVLVLNVILEHHRGKHPGIYSH